MVDDDDAKMVMHASLFLIFRDTSEVMQCRSLSGVIRRILLLHVEYQEDFLPEGKYSKCDILEV